MALTREWAVELLPYSIRANAVVPAEVMTPLYQKWLSTFPNPQAKLAEITRQDSSGAAHDAAGRDRAAVLFLCSAQASHITGQHLYVDGGYVHLDRALT